MNTILKGKWRGFASMTPEQQRNIASKGGKAATNRHKWTPEEASKWGQVGGKNKRKKGEARDGLASDPV